MYRSRSEKRYSWNITNQADCSDQPQPLPEAYANGKCFEYQDSVLGPKGYARMKDRVAVNASGDLVAIVAE